jgi:hypothetical protein
LKVIDPVKCLVEVTSNTSLLREATIGQYVHIGMADRARALSNLPVPPENPREGRASAVNALHFGRLWRSLAVTA